MHQTADSVSDRFDVATPSPEGCHPPPRRIALQTEVTFTSRQGVHAGVTQNLGIGGMFIVTRELRPIGERVRVALTMPDTGLGFEVEAEVRWVRPAAEPGLVAGMGLRLINLSLDARHAVEAVLRRRAVSAP